MNELIESSVIVEIVELHQKIMLSIKSTLGDAIRIGELLKEQKDRLPHGAFTLWIKANLLFTDRTARNYMKVFENREQLKTESVSVLTGAYRMLSVPKEAEQEELFKAGLQKYIGEGINLDEALNIVEWDEKYAVLNKKLVALGTEWETLKDRRVSEDEGKQVKHESFDTI
ncbi:MAG: DUF3102 domain-containing protein [Proteobacteria bacterium]|nr:DUF3102 domain-containing protein [Pseudomonadota bacterium]